MTSYCDSEIIEIMPLQRKLDDLSNLNRSFQCSGFADTLEQAVMQAGLKASMSNIKRPKL